jgi:hypothetical protein
MEAGRHVANGKRISSYLICAALNFTSTRPSTVPMILQRCTPPVIKTSAHFRYHLSLSHALVGFRRVATKSDQNTVSASTFCPLTLHF